MRPLTASHEGERSPDKPMNFFQKLFRKKQHNASHSLKKDRPADWNLTISDLMAEMNAGKRKSVGQPELDWAREYERSLIPEGHRFPRKGDVYESLEDQTVHYMTAWAAPFTGGGDAMLLKGEQIWINSQPVDQKPIGTYALPLEYEKLEERMFPKQDRENPKYGGFYFHFKTVDLNRTFRLVRTDFTKEGEQGGGEVRG